jgi:hypothetical protein
MYKKRIVVFLVLSLFVFTAVLSGSCDKATSDPRLVESLATLPVPEEDFLGDIQNTEITLSTRPTPPSIYGLMPISKRLLPRLRILYMKNTRSKSIWNLLRIKITTTRSA